MCINTQLTYGGFTAPIPTYMILKSRGWGKGPLYSLSSRPTARTIQHRAYKRSAMVSVVTAMKDVFTLITLATADDLSDRSKPARYAWGVLSILPVDMVMDGGIRRPFDGHLDEKTVKSRMDGYLGQSRPWIETIDYNIKRQYQSDK